LDQIIQKKEKLLEKNKGCFKVELINDDCIQALKQFPSNHFDSVVTDPPYGLSKITQKTTSETLRSWLDGGGSTSSSKGFMDKDWDSFVPPPYLWMEVFRVLKHGGYALVFAAPRTMDLMGLSLRLAGFEIKDCIHWLFGSGFPKSQDIGRMIEKKQGVEPVEFERYVDPETGKSYNTQGNYNSTSLVAGRSETNQCKPIPSTKEGIKWDGYGLNLKPAYEPCILVQKPLDGGYVDNTLKHGVGGLNIDGCRIGVRNDFKGRFPSNIIIDESVKDELDLQGGYVKGCSEDVKGSFRRGEHIHDFFSYKAGIRTPFEGDKQKGGGPSKFFYTSKTSRREREAGLTSGSRDQKRINIHPTVKPLDLMDYLCKLVTPKGGMILDPFMGSGSTGCSAKRQGFNFVGIERELEYFEIAKKRINYWMQFGEGIKPSSTSSKKDEVEGGSQMSFNWSGDE